MKAFRIIGLILTLLFFISPSTTLASTLNNQVPWGTRNHYRGYNGSNFNYYLTVGYPNFPGKDIYTGTGGTSSSGPYPNDPTAYYTGFNLWQPITFEIKLTNDTTINMLDNFWFTVSRVNSCSGVDLNSSSVTEAALNNCSASAGFTNQTEVYRYPDINYHDPQCAVGINGKLCRTIYAGGAAAALTLTYTWTPTQPGYYQFDFNSDDYKVTYPNQITFAAGFIRVPISLKGRFKDPQGNILNINTVIPRGTSSSSPGTCNTFNDIAVTNGVFTVPNVAYDTAFCLRPPAITGFTYLGSGNAAYNLKVCGSTNPCPANYECQRAGWLNPSSCSNLDLDDSVNTDIYDFIYQPQSPIITSLTVKNSSTTQTTFDGVKFVGAEGKIGKQSTQDGRNWYNPMTVTVDASAGSGTIKRVFVALYNSNLLTTSIVDNSSTPIPVTALRGLPTADYLVLKYTSVDSVNAWAVWDPKISNTNKWRSITNIGYDICPDVNCNIDNFYYKAYSNSEASWKIMFYENFGSKTLHTAVQVTNNYEQSAFNADITPTFLAE